MATQTTNLGLIKDEPSDFYNIEKVNQNLDKLDVAFSDTSEMKLADGTGTAITLVIPSVSIYKGNQKISFIASANNSGNATTIKVNNLTAKPLYKPNSTAAPNIVIGKAYEIWYSQSGDCFFLKASAEGNAIAANVLAGKTFSNDDDSGIIGTMAYRTNTDTVGSYPAATALSLYDGMAYLMPPAGYYDGSVWVARSAPNLNASNIKKGVSVGDGTGGVIQGTFTADANATNDQILAGQTAYSNGVKVTGTMSNRGNVGTINLIAEGAEYIIPTGYHNGLGKVKAVISGLIASVIKTGVTVGGIVGTFTSDANATAGAIITGYSGYVNGVKVSGSIPTKDAATYTPGIGNQTIPSGRYLSGNQTIMGDTNLIPANIISGKSIFGVNGTATIATLGGKRIVTGSCSSTSGSFVVTGLNLPFTPRIIRVKQSYQDSVGYGYSYIYGCEMFVNEGYQVSWQFWRGSNSSLDLPGEVTTLSTKPISNVTVNGFIFLGRGSVGAYGITYEIIE